MFRISLADFSHREELLALWHEAFGDGEKFISSFLNAYMIPEYNVPVIISDSDGKIASALYLVDFDLYSKTKILGKCAYLFAAATRKDCRNKGYMSKLVKYAAELCKNRGLQAVFLFPQAQNQKLFDFYAKLGFEAIYGAKRITRKPDGKNKKAEKKDFAGFSLETKDIADTSVFDRLYEAYADFTTKQELAPLKDRLFYFRCASSYLDAPENGETETHFAVFENRFENKVEKFCYVFYKKYKNTYYIDDIILADSEQNFTETADILADFIVNSGRFGENITLGMNVLPAAFASEKGKDVPLAMLLPLTDGAGEITRSLKLPVYINMFMNV